MTERSAGRALSVDDVDFQFVAFEVMPLVIHWSLSFIAVMHCCIVACDSVFVMEAYNRILSHTPSCKTWSHLLKTNGSELHRIIRRTASELHELSDHRSTRCWAFESVALKKSNLCFLNVWKYSRVRLMWHRRECYNMSHYPDCHIKRTWYKLLFTGFNLRSF